MSKLDFVDLFGTDGTVAAEDKLLAFLALIANLQSDENLDDVYDNLALYILEAAEGDDDMACHRYLIATGIQYLAKQAHSAPAMEAAAATYISELLIRILQSEEPNKVFKRTKPTAGPKQYPKLDLILAVALPETRRRNRLVEIKNRLADRTISRREEASLNTELEKTKDPKHVKLGESDNGIESSYYSQRRIDGIMTDFGEIAQFLFEMESETQ